MPWLGIGPADERVKDLREFYNIRSVPILILVDSSGEEVNRNCRKDIDLLSED